MKANRIRSHAGRVVRKQGAAACIAAVAVTAGNSVYSVCVKTLFIIAVSKACVDAMWYELGDRVHESYRERLAPEVRS